MKTDTDSYIERYRQRALSPDPNAMSGRKHAAATKFISSNIVAALMPAPGSTVVDVGCGNGAALIEVAKLGDGFELIGILPTQEEINSAERNACEEIKFRRGVVTDTRLCDGIADFTICNSVLTAIPNDSYELALSELRRITKTGGTVFLGEIRLDPEDTRTISQKFRGVFRQVKGPVGSWTKHERFVSISQRCGLKLVRYFEHINMDDDLAPYVMKTRRDFIFRAI